MSLVVPECTGSLLLLPRPDQYAEWAAANVALRGEALGGLATGHQPGFTHPGIWVKYFLIGDGTAYCVDSDVPGVPYVGVPSYVEGAWHLRRVELPAVKERLPWEAQAAWTVDIWRKFAEEVLSALETLPDNGMMRDRFRQFMDRALTSQDVLAARTLADSLTAARRAWEGQCAYREVNLSAVSGTRRFAEFAAAVVARFEEYFEAHNACLASYRAARRIRSRANPVPDLRRREDGALELPFWAPVEGGERSGLFAVRQAGAVMLYARDAVVARLDGEPSSRPARLPSLRPRALTLTTYLRQHACDLFIHGVGGARYDRVADNITRQFFNIEPTRFAVASLTMHPPWPSSAFPTPASVPGLQRALRDFQWNPQRHARPDHPWVKLKEDLVRQLEEAQGRARIPLAAAIRDVNLKLMIELDDQGLRLVSGLEKARSYEAQRKVLQWREYPYFLFDSDEVRACL